MSLVLPSAGQALTVAEVEMKRVPDTGRAVIIAASALAARFPDGLDDTPRHLEVLS